ncbi:MAG: rhomboid family intramembrane serine protease [Planctomycetota bacterium]
MLGGPIERELGAARTAALFLGLALASTLSEFLLLRGGVGLSGVCFGLVAYVWAVRRQDAAAFESVHPRVVPFFAAWFFVCIALTVTDVFPVGNLAHGAGAALGALVGSGRVRPSIALVVSLVALAGTARPFLNRPGVRAEEYALQAYEDLLRGKDERALGRARTAAEIDPSSAYAWYLLGIAYQRTEVFVLALRAYERAEELDPRQVDDVDMETLRDYVAEFLDEPR